MQAARRIADKNARAAPAQYATQRMHDIGGGVSFIEMNTTAKNGDTMSTVLL